MAFEGQQGIVAHHAAAVVGNADQFAAARLDGDDRCALAPASSAFSSSSLTTEAGPVDHFAGGNLVGYLVGSEYECGPSAPYLFPHLPS